MYTSFASGTLIVRGVLFAVLGLLAAGNLLLILVGLGSITMGGVLGLLERRTAG